MDLNDQLTTLIPLLEKLMPDFSDNLPFETIAQLKDMSADLLLPLRADTEQAIQTYIDTHIDPVLREAVEMKVKNADAINNYLLETGKTGDFHEHRKMYETTVAIINEKMSMLIDRWQVKAQDGVEHNLYIGQTITPNRIFNETDLFNLRLWQIQVLCQMEYEHNRIKETLPYPLNVTSLILAFSAPLSIRFRMDEKHFDVDGTYNARFEIVKKRIDKAFVKGSRQRITAPGKLTIVYSNHEEEAEYKGYIQFLQSKKMLDASIDMLEVEDLQGVSGLKAMRVKVCYDILPERKCYTYQDIQEEINTIG